MLPIKAIVVMTKPIFYGLPRVQILNHFGSIGTRTAT
jgi:hypothetical protein